MTNAELDDLVPFLKGAAASCARPEDAANFERAAEAIAILRKRPKLRFVRTADDRGSDAGWNVYIGRKLLGWIDDSSSSRKLVAQWEANS